MAEYLLDRARWLQTTRSGRIYSESVYPDVIKKVRAEVQRAGGHLAEVIRLYPDIISVKSDYHTVGLFHVEKATITFSFYGDPIQGIGLEKGVEIELKCQRGKKPVLTEKVVGTVEADGKTRDYKMRIRGPQYASEPELKALHYILHWLGPDTTQ
jgi:hypothetical protein